MRYVHVVVAALALSFLGCGGSGGDGDDGGTCPPGTVLDVKPDAVTVAAGGAPVQIFGGLSNGCQEMVEFTLSGPGALAPTSGIPVTYTPPASVTSVTMATITATAGGLTDTILVTINPAASTVWTGTAVGPVDVGYSSGAISLTFASAVPPPVLAGRTAASPVRTAATVAVTGTFKSGTLTVDLAGTYETTTRVFTVSGTGGGGTYTFTGGVAASGITGSFTLEVGGVSHAGSFTAAPGDAGTVTVYCGTYAGTSSGTWNLVKTGASLTGIATTSSGTVPLVGTVSGSSISLSYPSGGPSPGTAAGTITGTGVTGTWQIPGAGESGTFSGSTGC